jgi:pyruvate/2-oxoglutarate dehydrogenase complex dihydrolipoamide dehydrogenase (E3) component
VIKHEAIFTYRAPPPDTGSGPGNSEGAADAQDARCVVIGAGVLGACVAARLAEAGIGVTLLERASPAAPPPGRALPG